MRKYILKLSLAVLLLVMFSCFSTESWMTLWTELWTELGNPLQSLLQVVNAQSWTCLGPLVGWLGSLFDYLKQLSSQTWLGFLTLLATVVIAIFTKKLADFTKLLAKETELTRHIQERLLQLEENRKQLEEKQKRQGQDISSLQKSPILSEKNQEFLLGLFKDKKTLDLNK